MDFWSNGISAFKPTDFFLLVTYAYIIVIRGSTRGMLWTVPFWMKNLVAKGACSKIRTQNLCLKAVY